MFSRRFDNFFFLFQADDRVKFEMQKAALFRARQSTNSKRKRVDAESTSVTAEEKSKKKKKRND